MSFGENLQFYRKQKNITQEQLAEQMGVSRQTVSKWEADSSYPEMEKILQLCDMFGCSMDTLLRGTAQDEIMEDTSGYDAHMNRFTKEITGGIAVILIGVTLGAAAEGLFHLQHFSEVLVIMLEIRGVATNATIPINNTVKIVIFASPALSAHSTVLCFSPNSIFCVDAIFS